jgi:hypothetical protein
MKSFKIYTERKDERYIQRLLSVAFDGFTVIHTKGVWKGQSEDSIIIEILTNNKELVRAIASKIKAHNQQDAVLISESKVDAVLI